MIDWIKQIVGIDPAAEIESVRFGWGTTWGDQYTAFLLFGCALLVGIAIVYYSKAQKTDSRRLRWVACIGRSICLIALLLILAQPVLHVDVIERLRPQLLLVFDGSESLALSDQSGSTGNGREQEPRIEQVRTALKASDETLGRLATDCRLMAYVASDPGRLVKVGDSSESNGAQAGQTFDVDSVASRLSADGQVTALGASLQEIELLHQGRLLAGVVMVSDFNENSGVPVLDAARDLNIPLYTVGVGPQEAPDAEISLHSDLVVKKDEQRLITVHVRQSGLTGRTARLELLSRRLGGISGTLDESQVAHSVDAPRNVDLTGSVTTVEFPYRPAQAGRFRLEARMETLDGEILEENNAASREVVVRDESIKLLFVEHEPTWEWRFVKEVFHRDRLVGREGFRTYLQSADFGVRRTSALFLRSLNLSRAEFFANDVVFISDVPAQQLSDEFQKMLVEYVRDFGGGLVVIAGPRFTAKSLARTKLAEMLPVILDPGQRLRVGDFRLRLAAVAEGEDFMQISDGGVQNEEAWSKLGELSWYQPVANLHPQGLSLAVHPTDRCADGETPQPIIALRRYGKGEVVYVGLNEMYRLRRYHEEKYYRRFWGQLMYRLGLSHALGSQKRFKVTTDRETYQVGDTMVVTVEAYDANFRPLAAEKLSGRWILDSPDGAEQTEAISIPATEQDAVFKTSISAFTEGTNRLLVFDPVLQQEVEVAIPVTPLSVERRSAVRNVELQKTLAAQTGGVALELNELSKLPQVVSPKPIVETSPHYVPLWSTWLALIVVFASLFVEWTARKLADLS